MARDGGTRGKDFGETLLGLVVIGGVLLAVLWFTGGLTSIGDLFRVAFAGTSIERPVAPVEVEPIEGDPEPDPAWSCFWDPTMDNNWHNDVRCTRPGESFRPELLTNQSFVTESDMIRAAASYEAELNGR